MLALTTALRPPLFQWRRFCFRHGAVDLQRLAEQYGNGAIVAADLDAGHATGAVGGAQGTSKVALVEDIATAGAVHCEGHRSCCLRLEGVEPLATMTDSDAAAPRRHPGDRRTPASRYQASKRRD